MIKNSITIKEIRYSLNLTQNELADILGVSFATVNRWEKGHCEPSPIALSAIKKLCNDRNIDFSKFQENRIIFSNERVTLYHGSKGGILGKIAPLSRDNCDFGKGFYIGTDVNQLLSLICSHSNSKLYKLSVNLANLKIIDLEASIDWALLVAFNRGRMEHLKGTSLYAYYSNLLKDCDIAIGYIADDRMFVVLDRFFNGDITDTALINCLSALKYGKQYVALTPKACSQIKIISEEILSEEKRILLEKKSEETRKEGIRKAEEICRKYRRDGRFFDEILKEGK